MAKRRLADEYDAAQELGEISGHGGARKIKFPEQKLESAPNFEDVGLTPKQIHEARLIRDAEEASPGIVRETLDQKLSAGEEPTKAALREAVIEAGRVADEYDAAQERGEVAGHGGARNFKVPEGNVEKLPDAEDIGLTRKEIHEARLIRLRAERKAGELRRAEQKLAGRPPEKLPHDGGAFPNYGPTEPAARV
jgi:hypothetical protein